MDDRTNWPGMANADLADELGFLRECLASRKPPTKRMFAALAEAQTRISEYPDEEEA